MLCFLFIIVSLEFIERSHDGNIVFLINSTRLAPEREPEEFKKDYERDGSLCDKLSEAHNSASE